MRYGYARVSGLAQEKGTSLDYQVKELKEHGCEEVYKEIFTGTKVERPVFSELIGKLKEGDTIVFTKLDRFARTVGEGTLLIQRLLKKGIAVEIMNMGGRIDKSPMGKMMLNIMLTFAEFERDMIVQRLSEGKAMKRAKGEKCEGRYKVELSDDTITMYENGMPVTEICRKKNISRTTFYARLKEMAI